MAIPDFQTIMLPLLEVSKDGNEHNINDAVEELGRHFELSEEEKMELLQSGRQPKFYNRVGWARTYLKKAGLLVYPRRGYFQITQRGIEVFENKPKKIDMKFLEQFPEYIEFRETRRETEPSSKSAETVEELTPEEALEDAYQKIRDDLAIELLEYVSKSTPGFFEKLVVELLVNMGYGGSRREAARAVGQRGDEGIDGIIDEDRLGLDTIYIQAKRWKDGNSVGRPEIQKFVGALQGQRAKKGIFITTSHFTETARDYVSNIDIKVVLIDGNRLSELMMDYGVGVAHRTTYDLKSLDTDYFESS
ncbi:MAG: restriction endonuclease [Anaerolineales bacterium]|nr:restriction endonuclease [Candidatus Brocadiales bacterium]MBL6982131.1 restriction endonuclease [Anaerolineales bacterium]